MKAYRVKTDTVIEPFHRHPSQCLILNRELCQIQENIFRNIGIELKDVNSIDELNGEGLVFFDHTFFTLNLVKEFIDKCERRTSVLRLRKGEHDQTVHDGDHGRGGQR